METQVTRARRKKKIGFINVKNEKIQNLKAGWMSGGWRRLIIFLSKRIHIFALHTHIEREMEG
jgi:hypothetical protein